MGSFVGGLMSGFSGESNKNDKTKARLKGLMDKIRSKVKGGSSSSPNPPTSAATARSLGKGGDTDVPSYKRGGRVRKTGLAKLHKGEKVLTKGQAKRFRRGRAKGRY